jgi:hypothetical protein
MLLLLLPAGARAGTFFVDKVEDSFGPNYYCTNTAYKGNCSLRIAIEAANSVIARTGENIIIVLNDKTYTLTRVLPDIAVGNFGGSITVKGVGADATVIQRPCVESTRDKQTGECSTSSGEFRIFYVAPGASLSLVRVTVRGGQDAFGGGILNDAGSSLTLIESSIKENHGHGGGGGIANLGGHLFIKDSTVRNNFGHNGSGGGILNVSGDVRIRESTISGNKASYAGGIYNGAEKDQGGLLEIVNSTISGNEVSQNVSGYGGGIVSDGVGEAWLGNVTITANSAPYAGGVFGHVKGTQDFHFMNTIIAGNIATRKGSPAPDCFGSLTTVGGNLVGNTGGFEPECHINPWRSGLAADVIQQGKDPIDPKLGPLSDNGGPTCTHKLLNGSPAINAGWPDKPGSTNFACAVSDQRGAARSNRCDIGAFELSATVLPDLPGELVCDGQR